MQITVFESFILSSKEERLKKRVFKLNFFFNPNTDSSGLFMFDFILTVSSGFQKSVTAPPEAEETMWTYLPRTPREWRRWQFKWSLGDVLTLHRRYQSVIP